MSLRPIKKRSRRWNARGGPLLRPYNPNRKWQSNWEWNPQRVKETGWKLFANKRFILGITALIILTGTVVLAQGPLFHSTQARPACEWKPPNPICNDPTQIIWHSTSPNNDLSEFNVYTGSGTAIWHAPGPLVSACQDSSVSGPPCVKITPGNSTVILLSKSSIGDLSTASKNLLGIFADFAFETTTPAMNQGWGIYLTTNGTVPTGTGAANYDPAADPAVVLDILFNCAATCGGVATFFENIQFLRTVGHGASGDTIGSEATACNSGAGSSFLCNTQTINSNTFSTSTYINYTGVSSGAACTAAGNNPVTLTGAGCSISLFDSYGQAHAANVVQTQALSWLQLQAAQYYVGYYVTKNVATTIDWYLDTLTSQAGTSVFSANLQTGPAIDTGGFFGPVIKALTVVGVFVLNELLQFVGFIAPAVQTALKFLETQVQSILDLIGNALGFGNVGSDLASFLNSIVGFFTNGTYGLPAFFTNFPNYFTNFLKYLQVQFPLIASAFTLANGILTFAVSGISEALTIFLLGVNMLFFAYGTFIVFSYFLYAGDDGIGGVFSFIGTLQWLSFGFLNLIVKVVNLGLDLLVHVISLIPKPLIQMGAAHLPRLPSTETTASPNWPRFDFGEARNGNLLVYWLWCMGLWFLLWFETQNPALPGSLVFVDPAIATNVRNLAAFIPLMQAATLVSGGLVLAWFAMLPMRLAGIDVTEAPVGVSLGRSGGRPGGVSFSPGKKHLIGVAKRFEAQRLAGKTTKAARKIEVAKQKEVARETRKVEAEQGKKGLTAREEAQRAKQRSRKEPPRIVEG